MWRKERGEGERKDFYTYSRRAWGAEEEKKEKGNHDSIYGEISKKRMRIHIFELSMVSNEASKTPGTLYIRFFLKFVNSEHDEVHKLARLRVYFRQSTLLLHPDFKVYEIHLDWV